MVGGLVKDLSVGQWSVAGGVVGGFVIRPKCVRYYKVHQVLQGVKDYYYFLYIELLQNRPVQK